MDAARPSELEDKSRDAPDGPGADRRHMIRTVPSRRGWPTLLALAAISGGAFFFVRVAVSEAAPLPYVWARLRIAAAALWLFLWWRGTRVGLPRKVWGGNMVLAPFN